MEFPNNLPECVMMQIFRYLPFKDRVRAGRVNSSFRRMSKMAISETKALDISDKYDPDQETVKRFTTCALSALLSMCGVSLEKIKFDSRKRKEEKSLLETFSRFHYQNLRTLECSVIPEETLSAVLRNCPNLKELLIHYNFLTYPDDDDAIASERLEMLQCWIKNKGFRSLTGRVPNLKHLTVTAQFKSPLVFDRFLRTVPNLETLRLSLHEYWINRDSFFDLALVERMKAFWRLKHLTELQILDEYDWERRPRNHSYVGDDALVKVAQSFPRLRVLSLLVDDHAITVRGLTALSSSLVDLRELSFICVREEDIAEAEKRASASAFRSLTKCRHLRKLRYDSTISPTILAELFRACRDLDEVHIVSLGALQSPNQIVALFESMGGTGRKEILLQLSCFREMFNHSTIWESYLIKAAVEKLKREEGLVVKCHEMFTFRNLVDDCSLTGCYSRYGWQV